jgi:hypothetical protein
MMGYDVGARLEPDDKFNGPFSYDNAREVQVSENLLSNEILNDGQSSIDPLLPSGKVAGADNTPNSASEFLSGMRIHSESTGESEAYALSHIGRSLVIPGEGNGVGDAISAFFHRDLDGMLPDMPSSSRETIGPIGADMTGKPASGSIAMPIRKSSLEEDVSFSAGDEEASEAQPGQTRHYVPDFPGLAGGQAGAHYSFPTLPEAADSGERSDAVSTGLGHADRQADQMYHDALTTDITGGGGGDIGVFAPTDFGGDVATESDVAARALVFQDAQYDRNGQAYEALVQDRQLGSGLAKEDEALGSGAAIAGRSHRFDPLGGFSAAGGDGAATEQDGDTPLQAIGKSPDWPENDIDDEPGFQNDWRRVLPSYKIPGEPGLTGLEGMWAMVGNSERFLPKPSVPGRLSEEVAAARGGEGPESQQTGLGQLLPRGNLDELDLEVPNMRSSGISSGGGRSGPSGHKDDPIYMVPVNQMSGTLMPTVATAGTSTRTPPMPGQRNLP